jgi:hypothetical protein
MKKVLVLLSVILLGIQIQAQKTNLVFFTEQGERFYLVLNGIQQNTEPQSNMMITDLPAPFYKLKIIFEDTLLGAINKNIAFGQETETTFIIKKSIDNEWIVRYMNELPLGQEPPPPPTRQVIVYSTVQPANAIAISNPVITATMATPPANTSVGLPVSDPGTGVNTNMNIDGTAINTTTTTAVNTTSSGNTTPSKEAGKVKDAKESPKYVMPGYTGPIGCPWPVTPDEFEKVKKSIYSKSTEDSRLSAARQVIAANCFLCEQVKAIILLFGFEDTRLELAKYAYGYTYDIGNYYQLNDAFTFESSIKELNEYINSFRW